MVTDHTVKSYDKDLQKLHTNIIEMIMLVKDMLIIANKSIQKSNEKSYVEIAYNTDLKINNLDILIENKATTILALRQPMAIDLRESIAALKMAVMLERMGDLAKHITSRVDNISQDIDTYTLNLIDKMSKINIKMIEDLIVSYKNSNLEIAKSVCLMDNQIDEIYSDLMNYLEQQTINSPNKTSSILKTIFAIKNLERIGDYTTKLANLVNYIINGERKIIINEDYFS